MTRAEAAQICQSVKFILENSDYTEAVEEALNMAIEALQQEPFDKRTDKRTGTHACDCISRQAAIDAVTEAIWHYPNECYKNLNVYEVAEVLVSDAIKSLPSADRPTGHWIENDNGTFSCSNCQSWIPEEQRHYARHCLYCGARMESEE